MARPLRGGSGVRALIIAGGVAIHAVSIYIVASIMFPYGRQRHGRMAVRRIDGDPARGGLAGMADPGDDA